MAHKKYAHAVLTDKVFPFEKWMDEIVSHNDTSILHDNSKYRRASKVLQKVDPSKYLLSHATIIASVDTYAPKNVKLGKRMYAGNQINVKYPDYRMKPYGFKIINNNGDAWERSLLLSTYRTFIGAPNYLEHVQIPDLSKGFIIDAVARDLGESCYIDILVATDKKHSKLVTDIENDVITGLSMGCISQFTICTKCGNVAYDDSQLCSCIQYEGKGTMFTDENGDEHPICELVGHVSDPTSNQFIEASWVHSPAFAGAVKRNILNYDIKEVTNKMATAVENSSGIFIDGKMKKVAADEDAADEPAPAPEPESDGPSMPGLDGPGSLLGGPGGSDDEPDDKQEDDKEGGIVLDSIDDIKKEILNMVRKEIKRELSSLNINEIDTVDFAEANVTNSHGEKNKGSEASVDKENSNVQHAFIENVKSKIKDPRIVDWTVKMSSRLASNNLSNITDKHILSFSLINDAISGKKYNKKLYKVMNKVGRISKYSSKKQFLMKCGSILNRKMTHDEMKFFIEKGTILNDVYNVKKHSK